MPFHGFAASLGFLQLLKSQTWNIHRNDIKHLSCDFCFKFQIFLLTFTLDFNVQLVNDQVFQYVWFMKRVSPSQWHFFFFGWLVLCSWQLFVLLCFCSSVFNSINLSTWLYLMLSSWPPQEDHHIIHYSYLPMCAEYHLLTTLQSGFWSQAVILIRAHKLPKHSSWQSVFPSTLCCLLQSEPH